MYQKPKKGLGQHFLIDKNIQEKIVKACKLKKTDTILEIGPGRGEITQVLLGKVKKVIAVEIDKNLCQILKEKFSSFKNLELLNTDILKLNLSDLRGRTGLGRSRRGEERLKVIANIPYYISTPIIAHLLRFKESLEVVFLTLQKELAMRLTALPGNKDYGAFSCFVQFYAQPGILFLIKNSSFWPKPKVDSCFVQLEILPQPSVKVRNQKLFFRIIRIAFNQRRKFFKNNLTKIFPHLEVLNYFKKFGLDKNVRAEELSLADFAKVADYFTKCALEP